MNNNYSLDTPTKRKVYVPGEDEIPFQSIQIPKPSTETDQTHRNLTWLFHRPQDATVFPVQPKAVKIEKKK
jgi:hypothetical protein